MSRRVTISDVAAKAEVSTASVSKVLRDAYGVSPAMRDRVRRVIDELGYRPRAAARGMRGRTDTIGVVLSDIHNPFFAQLIDGVTAELGDTPYQVLLGPAGTGPNSQLRMSEALVDRSMDGLLLIAPELARDELTKLATTVPTVVLGRHVQAAEFDSVVDDDATGAALVVDHLVALGHERIAMLTHHPPSGISRRRGAGEPPQVRREHGYRSAMTAHGLSARIDVVAASFSEDGGYEGARRLLERSPRPSAVFAGADIAALGVLRALYEAGLRVPEDVSVASYDNTSIAALTPISLTSVDQSGPLMGSTGARMLLERIEGRKQSVNFSVSPTLVARRSTGPAPSSPR